MKLHYHDETRLIPPAGLVRAELARSVREARRLRALLRISAQEEEDWLYYRNLTSEFRRGGREVGR